MSELCKKNLEKFLKDIDPEVYVIVVMDKNSGQTKAATFGQRVDVVYCERFMQTVVDKIITEDQKKEPL